MYVYERIKGPDSFTTPFQNGEIWYWIWSEVLWHLADSFKSSWKEFWLNFTK